MRKPRVYVVQRPASKDRRTGEWIEKFDLSAAKRFGALVDILPTGQIPHWDELSARMHHRLSEYQDVDYILALGDPVAIAAAAMIASHYNDGKVHLLKWDRQYRSYIPYSVQT